jgi:hypothetical protein
MGVKMVEKSYSELSPTAKRGINKFAGLRTSKCMIAYGKAYDKKTGKSSYNVENKEDFFKFVATHKVKC